MPNKNAIFDINGPHLMYLYTTLKKVYKRLWQSHVAYFQIFDLKGSVRNRLVNTYGKAVEELVLLDENLLKREPQFVFFFL